MLKLARVALIALLSWWTWRFLAWPMRQDVIGASFLHLVSLPFHEAGHLIFAPFGELATAAGGSVMQVLVPLACMIAFLTSSPNPFGAAVTLWWAGENLLDVALYANDARALNLVLLGGHTGAEVEGHDWERILSLTGALAHDHQIAGVLQVVGAMAMIGALIAAIVITVRSKPDAAFMREST